MAVVALAATLVSLIGSWIPSFWGDEAASVMSATRSLPGLFAMLGEIDAVHGLYYLGLHAWVDLVGASPLAVRLPSALAVGVTVAAVMLLVRRLSLPRVAVVAGIVCAVLPRITYMGEEARSYAIGTAFAAVATLLLVVLIGRRTQNPAAPGWRGWALYALLMFFGSALFIYVSLIAAAHAVILLAARADRTMLLRWAASVAGALAVASPVLLFAVLQRGQVAFLAGRDELDPVRLLTTPWFGEPLFAAVAWAFILVALVTTLLSLRHRRPSVERGVRMPRLDVVGIAWLLVPGGLLVTASIVEPVYAARYLSFCAPAAAVLIAVGIDRLARRRLWALALGVLLVVAVAAPVWSHQRQPFSKNDSDFAQTAAIIGANASPGDAVAFDENIRPSRRTRLAMHLYPADFAGLKDVTLDVPYTERDTWFDSAISIEDAAALGRLDDVPRLWVIDRVDPGVPGARERQDLTALGFEWVREIDAHRSVVDEYVRVP